MEHGSLTDRGCRDWRLFCLTAGGAAVAAALVLMAGEGPGILMELIGTAEALPGEGVDPIDDVMAWMRGYALWSFVLATMLGLAVLRLRGAAGWGDGAGVATMAAALALGALAAGIGIFVEWRMQTWVAAAIDRGVSGPRIGEGWRVLHLVQWTAAATSVAMLAWVACRPLAAIAGRPGNWMNLALGAAAVCGLCFLATGSASQQLQSLWQAKGGQPLPADVAAAIRGFGVLEIVAWVMWLATLAALMIAAVRQPAHAAAPADIPTPSHHTASPPPPGQPADRASE